MTGVSSEILKNLVLAGIRATICDARPFPDAVLDTPSFLLPPSATATAKDDDDDDDDEPASKKPKHDNYKTVGHALKPVVEDLNLLLGDCELMDKSVAELVEDEANAELLKDYPIVVASRISPSQATKLAAWITAAGNKFYVADCFGFWGASMMDLGTHTYRPEVGKRLLDPKPLEPYVPICDSLKTPLHLAVNRFHKQHPPPVWMRYRCILEYREMTGAWPTEESATEFVSHIQKWIQTTSPSLADHELFQEEALTALAKVASAEMSPVCAVLGGMVGNEVIKAISGKGEPANNTVLFDGETCKAWTFLVRSKEDAK